MSDHLLLGKFDLYWANFVGLIVLTAIEVAAVGLDLSESMTLFILVGIAIPKFIISPILVGEEAFLENTGSIKKIEKSEAPMYEGIISLEEG